MNKYLDLVKVKGIIQVGANVGQETHIWQQYTKNIIMIEPLPDKAKILQRRYPFATSIECALGTREEEKDFFVASNGGESSSLLVPEKHTEFYPNILFTSTIKVRVKRFDVLAKEYPIDCSNYNVVVTDTQGCDLDVLKGFGSLLDNIDLIISEYINTPLYKDNQGLQQFIEYLKDFQLVETFDENNGAGNAVFRRI